MTTPLLPKSLEELSDADNIKKQMQEAERRVRDISSEHYKMLRRISKLNLYFLATDILGYDKLSPGLHGNLVAWMMRTEADRFRLCLLPRGHIKTTLWTISDSVRCALPDDVGDLLYPESLGPDIRIMIGHETDKMASRILVSIATHFMSNPLLMGLFPECVPTPRKHRINNNELELPHKTIWNEPTFDTMGVGAKAQGRHFDKIKLDDIIGDKARDSKVEMETANEWIDNIQAFFISLTRGDLDITGTRWAVGDTYDHIMRIYGDKLKCYIRGAIEKNAKGEDVPIYPESFTLDSFEIIKKNPKIWSSQYANDPSLVDAEFLPQWLKYFNRRGQNTIVVFDRTPLGELKVSQYNIESDLDKVILVDPATSGLGGIVVTGTSSDDKVFTLETLKRSWRPPELVEEIFKLVRRYQPRVVSIEEVLFSEVFRPWMQSEMKRRNIYFNIYPYKLKGKAKEARIRGLANYYAGGKIYHAQDQKELLEEFRTLGASVENKHLLDAFAQGPEVWCKPWPKEAKQELIQLPAWVGRDANTGY